MVKLRRRKTNNNNNGSRKCCCVRSGSEQENFAEEIEVVIQEAFTKSTIRPLLLLSPPITALDHCVHAAFAPDQMSFVEIETGDDAFDSLELFSDCLTSQIAHVHSIASCITPGYYLEVHGFANRACTRFAVDFTCGFRSLVDGTIALHFNPRLQEGYVVRNSLICGYWGHEETISPAKFTLKANAAFVLIFYATASEFHVRVNGQHFCSFRHRVPAADITNVEFVGDIQIRESSMKYSQTYPFPADRHHLYVVLWDKKYEEHKRVTLPMPFTGRLDNKLKPGDHLEIRGKVKLLPHSFYVNLQHGFEIYPHPVIPLHLNPRFSASCGANAFVRNAWVHGKWLQEERAPGFPFSPGYSFNLVIHIDSKCFGIWVNDKLIAEYPYRVENQFPVDTIYIQGDIRLYHIAVHTKSRTALYGLPDEKPLISF